MKTALQIAALLAVLALGGQLVAGSNASVKPLPATPGITAAQRDATFTYDGSVGPAQRAIVDRAIASARPEARRLIERVDGLVTLRVGVAGGSALGTTQPLPDGTFDVLLDLGTTFSGLGQRGATRLVLHELGHVVDFALVPPAMKAQLDAAVPEGLPCPPGSKIGACAVREERFAESFAKWAMGDIGVSLYIGYAVPPPTDVNGWGAPLAGLL